MNAQNNTTLVGIDLGGTKLNVGLVRNNRIIDKRFKLIPNNTTDQWEIINLIIDTVRELVADRHISGIGIGVPSIVDRHRGIVYEVHNIPSWQEVYLADILTGEFNVPVFVDNDANCFALGEHYFGVGKNIRNMVGVTVGTGLGAGIINRGRLLEDAHGGSGEFGMVPYKDGVIEDYCSGKFFKNFYGIAGEELMKKAGDRDPLALKAFEEFGWHLGNALQIIMYAVDPEMIVIGGSIVKSAKFFDNALKKSISRFGFKKVLENFKIAYSQTPDISVLGAAALYFDRLN